MSRVIFPVFEAHERTAVDALAHVLREQAVRGGLAQRSRSFPFIEHSRNVVTKVRPPDESRFTFNEISILLLDWARACGDIELYVHQPYAFWLQIARIHPVPDFLTPSCEAVAAAKVPFLDFVQSRRGTIRRS